MPAPEAPRVTIGKHAETLCVPGALATVALSRTREQLEAADSGLLMALGAAALRECWPKERRWPYSPAPRPYRPGTRIEDYGAEIFDRLAGVEGVTLPALIEACGEAFRWAATARLTEEEVRAAEDFSGAPKGG